MATKSAEQVVKETKLAPIDRFTNAVISCYGDSENGIEVTDREKDIIKGYFMTIDLALRNSKDGYTWSMVELDKLAPRLKHYARLGLDMQIDNHLSPVPFRSGNSGKVTMNLIPGYEGRKYIAKKFAVEPYDDIIVKLVGKNDTFKPIYKDANHDFDSYIYEENNPFDKGEIVGGFAYVKYQDNTKNKLIVMSIADIKKHMPKHGSSFWTGEWKEKMWYKTLVIEACKGISLDAEKIRDFRQDLEQIKADELNNAASQADAEAKEKMGSGDVVDVDFNEVDEKEIDQTKIDLETGEIFD